MLTENEMLVNANKYIAYKEKKTNKELVIYLEHVIKKTYGNIYGFESKKYIDTGIFDYKLLGNSPFLVEKNTGRIVNFGTSHDDDYYIKAYENGTLEPSMDRYWYPETETYSHK